jgi:hypothetical protein
VPSQVVIVGASAADLVRAAVGLDTADRRVHLADGRTVRYDALVIATGVRPRTLPGADLVGVHLLRTLDDALTLRAYLLARPKMVVIGAGFLGAEIAAVARQMGLEVTVVDLLPVPMYRQFGERVGSLIARMHTDHGAVIRCGVGMSRLVDAGQVAAVELTDGSVLDADLVVVAIGAVPATGGVLTWNSPPRELRTPRQLVADRTPWSTIAASPRASISAAPTVERRVPVKTRRTATSMTTRPLSRYFKRPSTKPLDRSSRRTSHPVLRKPSRFRRTDPAPGVNVRLAHNPKP